jgi:transcriptional regulator with XRE-family HTH domain
VATFVFMGFTEKITALAKRHRFNQAEVSRRTGSSPAAVSKWFRGESVPGLYEAAALARALGVTLDFLADDTQDDPPAGPDPDEAFVLRTVRALKLDPEEAVRRLSREPSPLDDYAPGEEIPLTPGREVELNPRLPRRSGQPRPHEDRHDERPDPPAAPATRKR